MPRKTADDNLPEVHRPDQPSQPDFETVQRLETLDAAAQWVIDSGGELLDSADLIPSYNILGKNKDALVDKPFLILHWRFNWSDKFNGEFVSALVVTEDGDKFVVNDGSTGICAQLRTVTNQRGKYGGMLCRKGLTRSTYPLFDEDTGEKKGEGTTYYIA